MDFTNYPISTGQGAQSYPDGFRRMTYGRTIKHRDFWKRSKGFLDIVRKAKQTVKNCRRFAYDALSERGVFGTRTTFEQYCKAVIQWRSPLPKRERDFILYIVTLVGQSLEQEEVKRFVDKTATSHE